MEIFRIIADTLNSKALIKANTLRIFHQLSIINQQQLLDQTTGRFLAQAERMRLPLLEIWIGAEKHNAGLWTAGTIHQETQELQGCCTLPHRWRIRKSWPEERRKSEPRGFPDWVRYPPGHLAVFLPLGSTIYSWSLTQSRITFGLNKFSTVTHYWRVLTNTNKQLVILKLPYPKAWSRTHSTQDLWGVTERALPLSFPFSSRAETCSFTEGQVL